MLYLSFRRLSAQGRNQRLLLSISRSRPIPSWQIQGWQRRTMSGGAGSRSSSLPRALLWVAPLAVPLLTMGAAAAMWPLFDLFILPSVVRRALEARKFTDDDDAPEGASSLKAVASLRSHVEASQKARPRQITILYGPGAELLSREYVRCSEGPCGFVDFRNQWAMNPYEIGCLQHLGYFGAILNTYVKAIIFVGSVLSQRHPHIDTILYTHNVNNNTRRALQALREKGTRASVVLQHIDSFVLHGLSEDCKESRACFSLTSKSVAEFSMSLVDDGLADVIWALSTNGNKALLAPELSSVEGRVRLLFVDFDRSSGTYKIRQDKPHRGMIARLRGDIH